MKIFLYSSSVYSCHLLLISSVRSIPFPSFIVPILYEITPQTIESMEFSGPEYWSGLPRPSPGDLPNPRIELRSPALQEDSLPAEPKGKPIRALVIDNLNINATIVLSSTKMTINCWNHLNTWMLNFWRSGSDKLDDVYLLRILCCVSIILCGKWIFGHK